LRIVDFTSEHVTVASALALAGYEEERRHVAALPPVHDRLDLRFFADNGLGVAAFEGDRMIGFLCCVSPFNNAFHSTHVKGVFSPMGASAAVRENRAGIYTALYQAAGEKWVQAGAVSHAVCLYAHDADAQRQLFRYGFGMRCVDAIRPMEPIDCPPCADYDFYELKPSDFGSVYPLWLLHDEHLRRSPTFMNRDSPTTECFLQDCIDEPARYFVARHAATVCAFLKLSKSGETFITARADSRHITGACCLPEHRGKGVYQNLLNFAIKTMNTEGFTRLGVDFESINPNAWGFWLKYFSAYTHSVVRRVDERVLEINSVRCIAKEQECNNTSVQILSLRDYPERADECRELLSKHFNELTSTHPAEVVAGSGTFPQGYFMLKDNKVIGWTGLHEKEVVTGRVYGWEGSIAKQEILSDELSPWITPLLVHPAERGNRYGKKLLEYARMEAGRLGFKVVYLTTGEIGYYEKYGFREVGLTTFTWGRPTKVYEHDVIV
jgi:GNAT superfamily N-acetyltransferase